MTTKLSFFVPAEYDSLIAYSELKHIMSVKETLRKLLMEVEIINEQIEKYTQMNDEIKVSEYTILKHYALKEVGVWKSLDSSYKEIKSPPNV